MRNIFVSIMDFREHASLWLIIPGEIIIFFLIGVLVNLFILDAHFLYNQWIGVSFAVFDYFVIRANRKESKENSDNND